MANRDPYKARLAKWQKQWPIPIERLQSQAFAVLQLAYESVGIEDPEQQRRNIHVYFTALACFTKLLEHSELAPLAERISALEGQLAESTNGHHARQP